MPTQSDDLESVYSVAITFEMQKNDLQHDTVIHGKMDDNVLCPVLQWACLVNRIWTSRHFIGYSGVYKLEKWLHGTHYLQIYPTAPAISLQFIWKRSSRLRTSQHGYLFIAIRSSNGNVSWRISRLHHHAHWQVVERRFSLLHS
jgi:hypothetical protein